MRGVSRMLAAAGAAVLLGSGVAGAAEGTPPKNGEPTIGVGMICNTPQQAERFVALRAQGTAPEQAMAAVNREMNDPHGCGLAAIAFTRDATIDNKAVANKLVQVVRINVVAGFNGSGWQRVTDMVQYAVVEGEGETV